MDKNNIKINITYIFIFVILLIIMYVIYCRIFINNPKTIKTELLENNKFILKNKLIKFNKKSKNVALMIESRIFSNTEFIIRQFCKYLPDDFDMHIYVTSNVLDDYLLISKKLNNDITVKILPYELTSIKDYNDIMLDISFWKLLANFDRVLIFQNDTMIYNYNISDFYEYDYIGAPWDRSNNISNGVGNGGLSLRNIKAMIYCIENKDLVKIPFNSTYSRDKDIMYDGKYPEDVFYSYAMVQFGYNVADVDTASLFSVETYLYNDNVLGSHKLTVYNNSLYQKLLLKSIFVPNMEYVIPFKIYQTWYTKELPPLIEKYSKLIQKDNPEFEYYLYDDNDCIEFIKNNFDSDVSWSFEQLAPGRYKNDMRIYCILYINGGIYVDIKYRCINEFKLIALLDKEYFVLDRIEGYIGNHTSIYNGLIACKPKNELLMILINKIVDNVKNKFYGINSYDQTGPLLFAKVYEQEYGAIKNTDFELKYSTDRMNILYNDVPILQMYDDNKESEVKESEMKKKLL